MLVVKESNKKAVALACKFLREGRVISFASDTVYGVAADASNYKAIELLYKIKDRQQNKPIAIFLNDLTMAEKIFFFDKKAKEIAQKFLPGSLTLVLRTKADSGGLLASNLNQNDKNTDSKLLGFRVVKSKFINNLLDKFGGIIAVTSANKSGDKEAINAAEVERYFNNKEIALLIDGGETKGKIPSTVVKIIDDKITILRQGPIIISNL